ncbi:MAG: BatA domain-containing protein [Pirellulales bacterium]
MSLLTPLYVLGLLAVSLPIVFHLIRRAPRGDFDFSSLMFLSPSPPRLTRRSRLDHLLLLLLRGIVIGLLAFAFARPFLRQTDPPEPTNAERQRVAIIVDTSASMRRGDLWRQATAIVDSVMAERQPYDQVALYACDDALRPLVSFEDMAKLEPAQRKAVVRERLASIGPTWAGTHLGRGLLDAVEIVNSVAEPAGQVGSAARRIVLVTDLQQGSRLDALADYQWPVDVPLELRTVTTPQTTNAGLQLLSESAPTDTPGAEGELRVSVYNDKSSAADQFKLTWLDEKDQSLGASIDVYAPAGESRVVRVTRPPGQAAEGQRLRLSGDACDFDNTLYFAARPQAELSVVFLGNDPANDPSGLRYYLERALSDGALRSMSLRAVPPGEPLKLDTPSTTPLVVVAAEPTEEQLKSLRPHIEAGGTVLWVISNADASTGLVTLLGTSSIAIEEAAVNNYTMLGQIAFDHPLFAPMASPQFNDFTQIYFWKYRRLTGLDAAAAAVVARFENGDPAVLERRLGQGQFVVLTSGWQPADSQLARSWKFVLLVSALVDGRQARLSDRTFFVVNEPVPIRQRDEAAADLSIVKPDGAKVLVADDTRTFRDTNQPGVYALTVADRPEFIAVNLDPAESQVSPLAVEAVEQFGARLVNSAAIVENDVQRQQLRDAQLESRQKMWQWLIAAAFCVAVSETWLAGRITKSSNAKTESS